MADKLLNAEAILGGVDTELGGCRIVERDDLAVVSIATPLGAADKLASALKSGLKVDLPSPVLSSEAAGTRLIQTSADQYLVIFSHATPDANATVQKKLKGTAYTTDQTDVWARLEVSGANVRTALERLCPLDLHDDAFPIGASARTSMEHMGTIIIRTGTDSFLLMSASSSAKSFLHAVETSFRYTIA